MGRRRTLRGSAKFAGIGGLETKVEGNSDGSVYQTAKTMPVSLSLSLEEEPGAVFTKQELTDPQDVSFVEEQNGHTHLMSNAKLSGSVSYDPATGELSGFEFACAYLDYRRR